jgi:DNA-binding NtrC family response regulator
MVRARRDNPARVLIVEDDPVSRLLITRALHQNGIDTIEVSVAADGIPILERDRTIDVVFTDICLPGQIDGLGFARWVRENRPELPVILGTGSKVGREAAQFCKAHRTFLKPYPVLELVSHIRHLAEGRHLAKPVSYDEPKQPWYE